MSTVNLPPSLHAGDSLNRTFELPDYPAAAWALSFALVSAGAIIGPLVTTASGAAHALSVPASTSSAWAPGRYRWQAYVAKGAERITLAAGEIEIKANLAAVTTGLDTRSHAQRTLDAIEATIEGRASADVQQYEIAGRRLSKIPLPELLELRDRYRRDVRAEKASEALAQGLAPKNRLYVRL